MAVALAPGRFPGHRGKEDLRPWVSMAVLSMDPLSWCLVLVEGGSADTPSDSSWEVTGEGWNLQGRGCDWRQASWEAIAWARVRVWGAMD